MKLGTLYSLQDGEWIDIGTASGFRVGYDFGYGASMVVGREEDGVFHIEGVKHIPEEEARRLMTERFIETLLHTNNLQNPPIGDSIQRMIGKQIAQSFRQEFFSVYKTNLFKNRRKRSRYGRI